MVLGKKNYICPLCRELWSYSYPCWLVIRVWHLYLSAMLNVKVPLFSSSLFSVSYYFNICSILNLFVQSVPFHVVLQRFKPGKYIKTIYTTYQDFSCFFILHSNWSTQFNSDLFQTQICAGLWSFERVSWSLATICKDFFKKSSPSLQNSILDKKLIWL